MKRVLYRLSAREVETIKATGRHADGGGLYLSISSNGGRRWVFLYRDRATGRVREMGLGAAVGARKAGLTVAMARHKAENARRLLRDGKDPLAEKRAGQSSSQTFGEFADALLEAISPGFKNEKHREQWKSTLTTYCAPLRPLAINRIGTEDILSVLQPIWKEKPETASRVRGRIERVLDAAKAKGLRTGDNPARWRGHLKELLPKRLKLTRGHHAAVPYAEMPAFMSDLRKRQSISALALEFTILTIARTGETIGARWSEISFADRLWIVPAERMKASREHRVPLTDRAIEILRSLTPPGQWDATAFIFPGLKKDRPLSNMAMAELLKGIREGVTVHGFRSSFRDWAGDTTGFASEVIEMMLAHVVSDKTEAAYRRADALLKRRKLAEAWAQYLARTESSVVPMARANR